MPAPGQSPGQVPRCQMARSQMPRCQVPQPVTSRRQVRRGNRRRSTQPAYCRRLRRRGPYPAPRRAVSVGCSPRPPPTTWACRSRARSRIVPRSGCGTSPSSPPPDPASRARRPRATSRGTQRAAGARVQHSGPVRQQQPSRRHARPAGRGPERVPCPATVAPHARTTSSTHRWAAPASRKAAGSASAVRPSTRSQLRRSRVRRPRLRLPRQATSRARIPQAPSVRRATPPNPRNLSARPVRPNRPRGARTLNPRWGRP